MAKKSNRGGARPRAGRPNGSRNKASVKREAEIKASGLVPLDYMLKVLRDEKAPKEDRMWAATSAAPYVHPKLSAIEHTGTGGGPIQHENINAEKARKRVAERFAEFTGNQASGNPVVH